MANILLIDDDPDITDAGRLVLERAGHKVTTASSAETGLAAVRKAVPDLMVLDIMMDGPDDGILLARQLRKDGFRFPIIALTSISKVTGREYDRDDEMLPVDDFVAKPIYPAILVEKVNKLLGS
ncbi:MAG: response regulator [Rhodospirillaceae bacterium]